MIGKLKKADNFSALIKLVVNKSKQLDLAPSATLDTVTRSFQNTGINNRRVHDKLKLQSYLAVCVDVGQINKACSVLRDRRFSLDITTQHYNTVAKGWAKLGAIGELNKFCVMMKNKRVQPDSETYACLLLAHSNTAKRNEAQIKFIIKEAEKSGVDLRNLFHSTYLSAKERDKIKQLIRLVYPNYDDIFLPVPVDTKCELVNRLYETPSKPNLHGTELKTSKMISFANQQFALESKSTVRIQSIASPRLSPASQITTVYFAKLWQRLQDLWRAAILRALDKELKTLEKQGEGDNKFQLYPYLCSVDKQTLANLMLDEVENNAGFINFSSTTRYLHSNFGFKVMDMYLLSKARADGSFQERTKLYYDYLANYCTNPELIGQMNQREYLQLRGAEMKNYSIYKDVVSPVAEWPYNIAAGVGRFLYTIILNEIKFDPGLLKRPSKEINFEKCVSAFYTAYFQIDCTHKIKEEFRTHLDFEKLYRKCCSHRLKFNFSQLPTISPGLPWLSFGHGGYLIGRSELIRMANPSAEQMYMIKHGTDNQKLYPVLDSLNVLSFCPWIVNKDVLDIVIGLFRLGGDPQLAVPNDEKKMRMAAPVMKSNPSKADRILFNREHRRYEQKKREMFSLWCDCLYRLSIANHLRDNIFWLPHNLDFRGRTYPIAPHFNHLGSDLARSLLLFAQGKPLGTKGLDWLKIHVINLGGSMKQSALQDRLEYANSILHSQILDSADNPWDGKRWWTKHDNPWQVLAACKEIARAIRSRSPEHYVSHLPIHQDGSCNGLQHYAALGRDYEGASAVNLVPNDRPQDVYSKVVDIVETARKQDAENGDPIARMLEGVIHRKVIKQTVMTTVYGVTRFGARNQIARQLANRSCPEKNVWAASQYLTKLTFDSIGKMFHRSTLIQEWLNKCAHIIATRYRRPVTWETPLGLTIVQPYTNKTKLSELSLDCPSHTRPIAQLNMSKQKTAFPPNYIHSLDSCHMMLTSLFCQRSGLTFVSVHDCYWTHPSTVDEMSRICRDQFIALHSEPLLRQLSDQFLKKYGYYDSQVSEKFRQINYNDEVLRARIEENRKKGILSMRDIFLQVPEPGNLDLNLVRESKYFFS